jgi:hypothetical protein
VKIFKGAFIAALATTDKDSSIQLWDHLTPQVMSTLNLMQASRVNPTILAYEALNGPYNWNQYPLALLGCKAVVYKDGDMQGLWASRGGYLGPSIDHYQCNVYYIPETRANRVSGSTELSSQHCQLPNVTPHQHLRKLINEFTAEGTTAGATTKGRCLLKLLQAHIGNILIPTPPPSPVHSEPMLEQRVRAKQQRVLTTPPSLPSPASQTRQGS